MGEKEESASLEKETTSAATATRKVTSPRSAPSPRRNVPRDAPDSPVPPLERPAETATRKVTSPETAPPPRRRDPPVSRERPESPDLATTAVRKDISPETAPKPRRNPRPERKVKTRELPVRKLTIPAMEPNAPETASSSRCRTISLPYDLPNEILKAIIT